MTEITGFIAVRADLNSSDWITLAEAAREGGLQF